MSSVNRGSSVSPTVSVFYPAPGTVNKQPGVSNGASAVVATSHLLDDSGNVLTDDSGNRLTPG
jgi:hypothetical protein